MNPSALPPTPSGWREPMVWLVVGGPAAVVVASFITLALAIRHPVSYTHLTLPTNREV